MKIQHLIPILFLAAFCTVSAQTFFPNTQTRTDHPDLGVKAVSEPYYPIIQGQTTNDVIIARQITTIYGGVGFVFCVKATGEAVVSGSTNNICLYNKKLLTADSTTARTVFIGISQSIGTNSFNAEIAGTLASQAMREIASADNPHGKVIDLEPILGSEHNARPSFVNKLNYVELTVEGGQLVLHFASFAHVGRVIFDDQLNPTLMEATPKPSPPKKT